MRFLIDIIKGLGRRGPGSRGGRVHHTASSGRVVYQSEWDAKQEWNRKQKKIAEKEAKKKSSLSEKELKTKTATGKTEYKSRVKWWQERSKKIGEKRAVIAKKKKAQEKKIIIAAQTRGEKAVAKVAESLAKIRAKKFPEAKATEKITPMGQNLKKVKPPKNPFQKEIASFIENYELREIPINWMIGHLKMGKHDPDEVYDFLEGHKYKIRTNAFGQNFVVKSLGVSFPDFRYDSRYCDVLICKGIPHLVPLNPTQDQVPWMEELSKGEKLNEARGYVLEGPPGKRRWRKLRKDEQEQKGAPKAAAAKPSAYIKAFDEFAEKSNMTDLTYEKFVTSKAHREGMGLINFESGTGSGHNIFSFDTSYKDYFDSIAPKKPAHNIIYHNYTAHADHGRELLSIMEKEGVAVPYSMAIKASSVHWPDSWEEKDPVSFEEDNKGNELETQKINPYHDDGPTVERHRIGKTAEYGIAFHCETPEQAEQIGNILNTVALHSANKKRLAKVDKKIAKEHGVLDKAWWVPDIRYTGDAKISNFEDRVLNYKKSGSQYLMSLSRKPFKKGGFKQRPIQLNNDLAFFIKSMYHFAMDLLKSLEKDLGDKVKKTELQESGL